MTSTRAVKAEAFVRNKTNLCWHGLLRHHNIHMDHDMVKTLQRMRFVNQCKTRGTWHPRAEWRKCSTCGIICDAGVAGTCTLCIFLGVNRYADRHRFLALCICLVGFDALSVLRLLLHWSWSQFFTSRVLCVGQLRKNESASANLAAGQRNRL